MGVRIDQLINLPELKDLKLVGGNKGVSKIVTWVHALETPDLIKYVKNDDLIMLTGIGILNNTLGLIEMIEGLIEKKASGLIVNTGRYLAEIPNEVKKLADKNDFPVFEIPWEISLAEITRIICGDIIKRQLEEIACQDLLKNIIFNNKIIYEDFIEKISAYGYSYLNSFRIIIVKTNKLEKYLSFKNIEDEQNIVHVKNCLLRTVNNAVWDPRYRAISFLQNDSIVLLIINEKDKFTNLKDISQIIRESIKNGFPDVGISIGIGNAYTEFSGIKKSYIEAEKALKAIKSEEHMGETMYYSNIGAYKLLTEIENISSLKEYYDATIGRLEQYDAQNATDFTKIFYIFLQENGHYVQTAQRLYMHRNTLIYKINKIQEILKQDLTDIKVRVEFYLGYLIKQMNDF